MSKKNKKNLREEMHKKSDTLYLFLVKGPFENKEIEKSLEADMALYYYFSDYVKELYEHDLFIYAYTNSKIIADEFMRQRKKEKFMMKKIDLSGIDQEELEVIYSELFNLKIVNQELMSSTKDKDDVECSYILYTGDETIYVSTYIEEIEDTLKDAGTETLETINIILNMFSKETLASFLRSGYCDIVKMANRIILGVDSGAPEIEVNELKVFLFKFHELLDLDRRDLYEDL